MVEDHPDQGQGGHRRTDELHQHGGVTPTGSGAVAGVGCLGGARGSTANSVGEGHGYAFDLPTTARAPTLTSKVVRNRISPSTMSALAFTGDAVR